jgi:hypothetical protein
MNLGYISVDKKKENTTPLELKIVRGLLQVSLLLFL